MIGKCRIIIAIIMLVWLLSIVSCLTFTPDHGKTDQPGQGTLEDAGADEFIRKPFDITEVICRVADLVNAA